MKQTGNHLTFIDLVTHAMTVTTVIAGFGVSLGAFRLEGPQVAVAVTLGFYIPIGLLVVAAIAELVMERSPTAVQQFLMRVAHIYRRALNVTAGIFVAAYIVPPLLGYFLH